MRGERVSEDRRGERSARDGWGPKQWTDAIDVEAEKARKEQADRDAKQRGQQEAERRRAQQAPKKRK